jgi:moderate conductance mechanosensitive channel
LEQFLSLVDLGEAQAAANAAARVAVILLLAWLLLAVARRLIRAFHGYMEHRFQDAGRIRTVEQVLRHVATVVIVIVAGTLVLGELGISVVPILATAGVAGIAVGFGAQSLVKDFFTGLFLLIENQISEGDVIEAAGKSGYVERVTLRHVRIRDYDGSVHFIPNSMITTVTNRSRDYAYAVVDINVRRQQDLEQVFSLMHKVSNEMRGHAMIGKDILDDVDIAGVEKLEDATIGLRCRLKVRPAKQWRMRREFLFRMKAAMDTATEAQPAA